MQTDAHKPSQRLPSHAPAVLPLLLVAVVGLARPAQAQAPVAPWRAEQPTGPLQATIDGLTAGQTLRLTAGLHRGPIVIRVPNVTIDGQGAATIDGGGQGSVVTVEADGVTLRGLRVSGSGDFNPAVDAGVSILSRRGVTVASCTFSDVLFGVDVSDSADILIEGSEITSRAADLTMRGDAIRVWASRDVMIRDNYWHDARDAVAWYSERVTFLRNRAERSRYSVHSMYSKTLQVEGNTFSNNGVGVFIMYGLGATIIDNTVRRAAGVTGIGLGLKETSGVYARGNHFVYCATGLLVDNSPWEPGTRNWFHNNDVAFNDVGVMLANDREGNDFVGNMFRSNRADVDTEQRRRSPSRWHENVWEDYEGFDSDGDGIGDTPHVPRKYGDLLTGEHPSARFFTGSPVLELIGLIERLVPLTEPIELLEDPRPRRRPQAPKEGSHD